MEYTIFRDELKELVFLIIVSYEMESPLKVKPDVGGLYNIHDGFLKKLIACSLER